ncbi:MAG TPA: methylmalonyl-CoA epimerase [Actinomycetota bacterium]|jgi:methylmalonyl-CoA/ethylmalonyl-CoA epimerase|nr:methylmalonyl-CoA epimerase [Actinomycetota bacterium]
MLGRIEHIAIAVADLDAAVAHYRDVWGLEVAHRERVEDQGVDEAMLAVGDAYLQLLGPTGPDTTVARFVERRGEGLHHIAVEVDDLERTLDELDARGVPLIDRKPRLGGRGHMVAFVHPKGNHGLLVELIQRPSH